jgi:hypothetical protein
MSKFFLLFALLQTVQKFFEYPLYENFYYNFFLICLVPVLEIVCISSEQQFLFLFFFLICSVSDALDRDLFL